MAWRHFQAYLYAHHRYFGFSLCAWNLQKESNQENEYYNNKKEYEKMREGTLFGKVPDEPDDVINSLKFA